MNEPIRENDETELSLETIFNFFKRNLIILLVALLIGLVGGYCVSRFLIPRKYASSVSIFTPNSSGSLSLTELNLNKSLIGDYEQIIQSRPIINEAYEKAKTNAEAGGHPLTKEYTYGQLVKAISFGNPGNNCILTITMTTTDPFDSAYLVNAVATVAAEKVPIIMNTRSFSVYQNGQAVLNPVSPNDYRNAVLGGLVVLVLTIGVLALRALFDTSLKNAEDVKLRLGLETLGFISDHSIEEESGKRRYGYGYGYSRRTQTKTKG